MRKNEISKRTYRYIVLCLSGLCLSGLCIAGCGKKNVNYIGNEQESTDVPESLVTGDSGELNIWEESFAVEKENGDTVTVKIRTAVSDGPDTSQVIGIKRMTLDEGVKERIARAALGDGVSLEGGIYTGGRDGISYQMRIGENRISLYPEDIAQVAPEELEDALGFYFDANSGTNRCELPEDAALALAEQFLEEIGFSDRCWSGTATLVWTGNMESLGDNSWRIHSVQDGYVFYFEQTLQGESLVQLTGDTNSSDFGLWQEGEESENLTDTRMHTIVCVDSHGVVAADIQNIYEITSIEDEVSLLPAETVRGILQKEVAEPDDYVAEVNRNFLYYWGLNFDYCLLWDGTSGQGSYVPVWELLGGSTDITNITVNAIDGSIITWEQKAGIASANPVTED